MQGNNTILHSVVAAARDATPPFKPHVVVSNLEHASVQLTAKKLLHDGHIGEWMLVEVWCDVTTCACITCGCSKCGCISLICLYAAYLI